MQKIAKESTENASLVIGGKGAWNKLIDPIIIEEYGTGINTQNIVSYLSLLRIIRNIIQHPEHLDSMMALCGKAEPSAEEILAPFLLTFPWFYPHSYYCASQLFDSGRTQAWSRIFLASFKEFEDFVCSQGLANQSIAPLQTQSFLAFEYECSDETQSAHLVALDSPRSCVVFNNLRSQIAEMMMRLQATAGETNQPPLDQLIFRYNGRELKNPFWVPKAIKSHQAGAQEAANRVRDEVVSPSKRSTWTQTSKNDIEKDIFLPEGVGIQILKPEVQMYFPQLNQLEKMAFRSTHNVKAIKGFAIAHVWKDSKGKLKVTWNGRILRDKDKLVDFDFVNQSFEVINASLENEDVGTGD